MMAINTDDEVKDDDRRAVTRAIIEGLRRDAFQIAKDIGIPKLYEEGGIDRLVKAIRDAVFPLEQTEAKERTVSVSLVLQP